jgi:hypothetical protein
MACVGSAASMLNRMTEQNRGSNADVELLAFTNIPALLALEDWRANLSLVPDLLKQGVKIGGQFDNLFE